MLDLLLLRLLISELLCARQALSMVSNLYHQAIPLHRSE